MNLPPPRDDGLCVICEFKEAITNDGRLCKGCFKEILDKMNPQPVRDLSRQGTEQVGRPARDPCVLGGEPE